MGDKFRTACIGCVRVLAPSEKRKPDGSFEERRDIVAEHAVLLRGAEKSAVAAHVIEALLVRAEALHVGHVGVPDELLGAEKIAHAAHQVAPSLVNQFTVIVKSSTLVSVITVQDLMFQSQKIVHTWLDPIEILTATAAIYILVVFAVSALGKALADLLRRRYGLAAS
jgi:hypothetical protein